MFTSGLFFLLTIVFTVAEDEPIVQLRGMCPSLAQDNPSLHLTADVPAYAMALCRNSKMQLTAKDEVNFILGGTFNQSYKGERCQFYKKDGSNTYTVDVEVGWGEPNSKVVQQRRIKTISCAYDDHGRAVSSTETITHYFLNPWEQQHLLGDNASAVFNLQIWDVLDKQITTGYIQIGRKIRLVAYDIKGIPGFRALSCEVRNNFGRYYILRAGCGDGLVFPKTTGFDTRGNCVYSPYFDTFKLSGDDNEVTFECVFTTCDRNCDGSSCPTENENPKKKSKRSVSRVQPIIVAKSGTFKFK